MRKLLRRGPAEPPRDTYAGVGAPKKPRGRSRVELWPWLNQRKSEEPLLRDRGEQVGVHQADELAIVGLKLDLERAAVRVHCNVFESQFLCRCRVHLLVKNPCMQQGR